ncbi:MAG: hypothetical protein JXA94_00570 [Parachlamydiales bacterium]|nr:hypothetical protein [Parachlamydiales bacterium]
MQAILKLKEDQNPNPTPILTVVKGGNSDKDNQECNMWRLVAAYSLIRKMLNEDIMTSTSMTNALFGVQDSENKASQANFKLLHEQIKELDPIINFLTTLSSVNTVVYVITGIVLAGAILAATVLTGGMFAVVMGIMAPLVFAIAGGFQIAQGVAKIMAGNIQKKIANLEAEIGENQSLSQSISTLCKFFYEKLSSIVQGKATLDGLECKDISAWGEGLREIKQRVATGYFSK